MSVEEVEVVDAISTGTTGDVTLAIMDHLPWDEEHLVKLELKLAAYVRFIESGQILESYPDAKGRALSIRILIKYRPNDLGLRFLENAGLVAAKRALRFEYMPIPKLGYAADGVKT